MRTLSGHTFQVGDVNASRGADGRGVHVSDPVEPHSARSVLARLRDDTEDDGGVGTEWFAARSMKSSRQHQTNRSSGAPRAALLTGTQLPPPSPSGSVYLSSDCGVDPEGATPDSLGSAEFSACGGAR